MDNIDELVVAIMKSKGIEIRQDSARDYPEAMDFAEKFIACFRIVQLRRGLTDHSQVSLMLDEKIKGTGMGKGK